MQTEFLIIGQGICGSFLSWELMKAERSFIIIDDANPSTASRIASGIINPITGRRMVKTWMIDELLPFAYDAYRQLGAYLGIECIHQKDIIDCFPTAQMRLAFLERYQQDPQYLKLPEDENDQQSFLRYDLGYGMIQPCYLVDLPLLLAAFRTKLQKEQLLEERFDLSQLQISDSHFQYQDIEADKIIFCDGRSSFENPYFNKLPFALSKGEALIVDIPDLPRNHIYKKGLSLVPWKEDLFWVGSSYEWDFENDEPTSYFKEKVSGQLKEMLKIPFTIQDHLASLRPGTLERRPFVGWHPLNNRIGILNGMGTKGCSLAPYFAQQLVDHTVHGRPILPAADVARFLKVLSR